MAGHKDLTGTDLHQPKGMSTATGGASDVGKVVTSDGAGASSIRKLIPAEVGLPEHYGQLTISNNATVIAMTAATDSTLATNSDYIQVTGVFDAIPHGVNRGVTQQTNSLTATQDGTYHVEVWLDAASSVVSTTMALKFAVDGVISLVRRPKNFLRNSGEFHNMAAFGLVPLTANQVITLHMASDKTADITLEDAVFQLTLVMAT